MRAKSGFLLVTASLGLLGAAPVPGECAGAGGSVPSHCLYRSAFPSAGIVADCRSDRECRVGYYYGDPATPVWLIPPAGMTALPKPDVIWRTATLAEIRFDCGHPCSVSYFFEAKRRRLSEPRRAVLDVDPRRLLLVEVEDRALVVRQVFSGREVARIERPWAAGTWLGDAIEALHFDPDGRLTLTWLRGAGREPVTERISVPSIPR
ncbi:MAG TPA: hypothetical protein VFO18_12090, partial [Methylomirabilota bacterium]|nr:hypothetical protein [Methylomirabilota bacterium]